jgi:hypothetical protein
MEALTVRTLPPIPSRSAQAVMVSRNGWWLSTAMIVPVERPAKFWI